MSESQAPQGEFRCPQCNIDLCIDGKLGRGKLYCTDCGYERESTKADVLAALSEEQVTIRNVAAPPGLIEAGERLMAEKAAAAGVTIVRSGPPSETDLAFPKEFAKRMSEISQAKVTGSTAMALEIESLKQQLAEAREELADYKKGASAEAHEADSLREQLAAVTSRADRLAADIREALAEHKAADLERLKETEEAHREADKWKAEDDMYGYNFHEGKSSGTVAASLLFYRVRRRLEKALAALDAKKGGAE